MRTGAFPEGRQPLRLRSGAGHPLGAAAARLIAEEKYGYMCAVIHDEIVPVPLEEVAGKLKKVPADCPAIQAAKEIGMSFGN